MPGWPLWTLTVAAMLLPIPHVAFKLIDKRRGR